MTYVAHVRPCRWGWVGVVTLAPESGSPDHPWGLDVPQFELVEPPTYWRPTKAQAINRTLRKCRAWNRSDEYEKQVEVFDG